TSIASARSLTSTGSRIRTTRIIFRPPGVLRTAKRLANRRPLWRRLPSPKSNEPDLARAGCVKMREYVAALRAKLEVRFPNLVIKGIGATSQPFLMWKNRQYAAHRRDYDPAALQVEGETKAASRELTAAEYAAATNEFGPGFMKP